MGGHGTTLGGAIVDAAVRLDGQRERFPMFSTPDASYHGMVYAERFGPAPSSPAPAASTSARPAPCCPP